MRTRTALGFAAAIVALKAVLIGGVARGRCEMIGRCGDGTAWYVGFGAAGLVLVVVLIATIGRMRLAQTHLLSRAEAKPHKTHAK